MCVFFFRGYIGIIMDNGKENGKENGNYHSILGLYRGIYSDEYLGGQGYFLSIFVSQRLTQ